MRFAFEIACPRAIGHTQGRDARVARLGGVASRRLFFLAAYVQLWPLLLLWHMHIQKMRQKLLQVDCSSCGWAHLVSAFSLESVSGHVDYPCWLACRHS